MIAHEKTADSPGGFSGKPWQAPSRWLVASSETTPKHKRTAPQQTQSSPPTGHSQSSHSMVSVFDQVKPNHLPDVTKKV